MVWWRLPIWILWSFNQALARIGGELAEIKAILRDRNEPTTAP